MAVCGKDLYWREFVGCIPKDAVLAGHGLYVGQGIHNNALIPGALYESGLFVFEYNGKMETTRNVKILCSRHNSRFNWEPIDDINTANSEVLERALPAGYDGATRYYIGRVFHGNEWKVSKVDLVGSKKIHIWNSDGTTHLQSKFELLTYT